MTALMEISEMCLKECFEKGAILRLVLEFIITKLNLERSTLNRKAEEQFESYARDQAKLRSSFLAERMRLEVEIETMKSKQEKY